MKLPTPRKRGNAYRIEIMLDGKRYSATRDTKKECEQWAAAKVVEFKAGKLHNNEIKKTPTLSELLDLYYENVVKYKRSKKKFYWFYEFIKREYPALCSKQIHEITPQDLTWWRNHRLKNNKESTVMRDMNTLSPVFTYAVKELFLIEKNPFSLVVKPTGITPRNRRISDEEIQKILDCAEYKLGDTPQNSRHYAAWMFLFAIYTTMRSGEILNITKEHIKGNYIHLPMTKNGDSRDVPLNSKAREMLSWINHDDDRLIPHGERAIKISWGIIKKKAGLLDLHFHDTRHEAISRFVRDYKMPVETLAKITGHKDLKILLNTYYNPTINEIAQWLD